VSIVIAVYNEKSTIDEILRRVLDTEVRKEVIIVDDCSTDGTRQFWRTWRRGRQMEMNSLRHRMEATRSSCGV